MGRKRRGISFHYLKARQLACMVACSAEDIVEAIGAHGLPGFLFQLIRVCGGDGLLSPHDSGSIEVELVLAEGLLLLFAVAPVFVAKPRPVPQVRDSGRLNNREVGKQANKVALGRR